VIKKMARIGFFSSRRLKSSLQNVKSNCTESNIKTNIRRNRSGITEVLGKKPELTHKRAVSVKFRLLDRTDYSILLFYLLNSCFTILGLVSYLPWQITPFR